MRGPRADIDLTTPRGAFAIVGTALSLFGSYPLLLLALTVIVVAPYSLIVLAVTGTSPLGASTSSTSTLLTLLLIDLGVVVPIVSAFQARAVAAIARGEHPRVSAVLREGLAPLLVVIAAQLMADLGIFVGLLLFVLPGVLLAVRWAVVAQTAAVENTDWMGAIRRATQLSLGNGGHVFLVLIIGGGISYGITRAATLGVGSHAGAWEVVVGIALETVTRGFSALCGAVLYFELRGRAEAGSQPSR